MRVMPCLVAAWLCLGVLFVTVVPGASEERDPDAGNASCAHSSRGRGAMLLQTDTNVGRWGSVIDDINHRRRGVYPGRRRRARRRRSRRRRSSSLTYTHRLTIRTCGKDNAGGKIEFFCVPWQERAANGGCYEDTISVSKNSRIDKSWTSDEALIGAPYSSTYSRFSDLSLSAGSNEDVCIDYIRAGTQQSDGSWKLYWWYEDDFWLAAYGSSRYSDVGSTFEGDGVYYTAILGACSLKLTHGMGNSDKSPLACSLNNCASNCNDGEGWNVDVATCVDYCPAVDSNLRLDECIESDRKLHALREHDPRCSEGLMQGWSLKHNGCDDSDDYRIDETCLATVTPSNCVTRTTRCWPTDDKSLQYLDAHNFNCGTDEAMQSWRLKDGSDGTCSGSDESYGEYTCCDIKDSSGSTLQMKSCNTQQTSCLPVNGLKLHYLAQFNFQCADTELLDRWQLEFINDQQNPATSVCPINQGLIYYKCCTPQ